MHIYSSRIQLKTLLEFILFRKYKCKWWFISNIFDATHEESHPNPLTIASNYTDSTQWMSLTGHRIIILADSSFHKQ